MHLYHQGQVYADCDTEVTQNPKLLRVRFVVGKKTRTVVCPVYPAALRADRFRAIAGSERTFAFGGFASDPPEQAAFAPLGRGAAEPPPSADADPDPVPVPGPSVEVVVSPSGVMGAVPDEVRKRFIEYNAQLVALATQGNWADTAMTMTAPSGVEMTFTPGGYCVRVVVSKDAKFRSVAEVLESVQGLVNVAALRREEDVQAEDRFYAAAESETETEAVAAESQVEAVPTAVEIVASDAELREP